MSMLLPFPCRSTVLVACLLGILQTSSATAADPPSYTQDVRPILSDKCFACHGPDPHTREAGLRLDQEEAARADLGGYAALVPGKPDESEALVRMKEEDPDYRMPPPQAHKDLSPDEIEIIEKWIANGAVYETHWAYQPLQRPAVPQPTASTTDATQDASSTSMRSPIDAFIDRKLIEQGLEPAPPADSVTLVRRLYLDLFGVPPKPEEVEAFLQDPSVDAWPPLVERLLQDARYGERMAVFWLDLVRYADTIGYHSDNPIEVSAYRDYVIDAFNQDKPYDEFTVEQLAGDLLPEPTVEQQIASGYNRLLQTTQEGGAQPKEYRAIYAADRVRNVSGVWLGSTMGCAQCHDHKYDPFTAKDFYSMAAFFADIDEAAVGARQPNLQIPTADEKRAIEALEQKIAEHPPSLAPESQTVPEKVQRWQKQLGELQKGVRTMLVSSSMSEPRVTRVLPRGNWMDDSGEIVEPAVPAFLPAEPIEERRATRLDLARWLVDEENPLTARTFVNRVWKLFMGRGLSANLDDLGGQGQPPSHPELLDWLAADFRDGGWDVKRLVGQIVTSDAYRRRSIPSARQQQFDPQNRWYARQSRWRVEAEFVRDTVLQISDLLVDEKVGGRSVKPYQPAGYWQHLNFPRRTWQADQGSGLYRRSLYTFWCRSFLHPSMLAFDAPTREECTAQRPRSNIPQQALVLLNDPIFVEASRAFGERILRQSGSPQEKIAWACRQAWQRSASKEEVQLLDSLYSDQRNRYAAAPEEAQLLLEVGDTAVPAELDPASLAAWTQVARAIINAYETTSRY